MQRRCALLRETDGALVGVVTSPFDLDLQTWLGAQAGAAVEMRLALGDLLAYHTRMEESTRAVDSLVNVAEGVRADGSTAQVLSFQTVNEVASPAVKLVNSTLYDALKAGASDIHLESTATGLALKYRIDGVLDAAATIQASKPPSR